MAMGVGGVKDAYTYLTQRPILRGCVCVREGNQAWLGSTWGVHMAGNVFTPVLSPGPGAVDTFPLKEIHARVRK